MKRYDAALFDKLFDHASAAMIRAFVAAANRMRSKIRMHELEAAIVSGDAEGVMAILGIDPSQFASLDDEMGGLYKASGELEMRYQLSAVNRQIDAVKRDQPRQEASPAAPSAAPSGPKPPGAAMDPFFIPPAPSPPRTPGGGGPPPGAVKVQFNARNIRAENYLRENSSRLVREITEDQRNLIRDVLDRGMSEGRNPRDLIVQLVGSQDRISGKRHGGVVGLTRAQGSWVANARSELESGDYSSFLDRKLRNRTHDRAIRAAMKSGQPLSPEKITRIINDYESRMLKMRAEAIARTEMLRSQNAGKYEAAVQAAEASGTSPDKLKRQWKSASDARVRDTHREMQNQTVTGFSEPFETSRGAQLLFPGDTSLGAPAEEVIHCRCMVVHEIDYMSMARENGWIK